MENVKIRNCCGNTLSYCDTLKTEFPTRKGLIVKKRYKEFIKAYNELLPESHHVTQNALLFYKCEETSFICVCSQFLFS